MFLLYLKCLLFGVSLKKGLAHFLHIRNGGEIQRTKHFPSQRNNIFDQV